MTDTKKALEMAIEAMKWLRMRSPIIYEELEAEKACKEAITQPAQEPVLNVEKIISEFPLLDDEGLDEDKHHCEWAIQQDRKRLHAMIKNTHPAPQPEQEPVGYTTEFDLETALEGNTLLWFANKNGKYNIPLYTHPAPSWQGLSNERIREIGEQCELNNNGTLNWIDFARAIEKKHGIG